MSQVDELFETLRAKLLVINSDYNIEAVEIAYEEAARAHEGQFRQSGEPYIVHPLHVALILAELEMDPPTIMAGLLHDAVEDTSITLDNLRAKFGDEVAELVDGVTKLKSLTYTAGDEAEMNVKEDIQAENYRKLFVAMARDMRVILIKLADRLHNMRTLEYKSKEKQQEKARETLDIYSPIANRLGISKIQVELDDLSLKYLQPTEYAEIKQKTEARVRERKASIEETAQEIRDRLEKEGITATVTGRQKHIFSIYKKIINKEKSFDQIYDLFAIRVIVDSVRDCYGVLGLIHVMYTPMPGRFKDYIAMPKPNMYQSLHTTLIGPGGAPFEVQIRTWDMHRTAEYGIAAHWKYKQEGNSNAASDADKQKWLQKILEWQNDLSDNQEYMNAIKADLDMFQENVYCFSPKGEVITLPQGATPIDFAYNIHSAVGNKMVGARVNDRIVTLDYRLQNGDRVEILTSQNSKGPSLDWLKLVATSGARNKINQWFKKELREENLAKGKELLDRYLKGHNMPVISQLLTPQASALICRKYGFPDWDAILATIGHGGLKEGQIANRLYEEYLKEHPQELTDQDLLDQFSRLKDSSVKREAGGKGQSPIVVRGIHDLAVRYSRCCNPLPGDEIVGFVTRGRGVSIHRTDCVNIMNMPFEERIRLIEAEWEAPEDSSARLSFLASLQIETDDEPGMLTSISACISDMGLSIDSLNARRAKDHRSAVLVISVEIRNIEQLNLLIRKLSQVKGVQNVIRTAN